MKIVYFVLLLIATLFFNACATAPIVYSPEQIDSFAIPPSNENNLFSPPKNGYARLIMYRDGGSGINDMFISYATNQNIVFKYVDNFYNGNYEIIGGMGDRALCRLDNNSSCIVNIRTGSPILLFNKYDVSIHYHRFLFSMTIIGFILPPFHPFVYVPQPQVTTQGTIFTPKNQHIYCLAIKKRTDFAFKDKNTCLKEYKEVYKPKHRKEQERWLNKLIKDSDKRAYQE